MASALSSNYARALGEVVSDAEGTTRALRELRDFQEIVHESSDLREFLANPSFSFDQKRSVIGALASKAAFAKSTTNLILTLLENERFSLFGDVVDAFREIADRRRGIRRGVVFSSAGIEEEIRNRLEQEFSSLTGSEIEFEYRIDRALIGGLRVQIGSTVFDGSVRAQLNEIQKRLSGR